MADVQDIAVGQKPRAVVKVLALRQRVAARRPDDDGDALRDAGECLNGGVAFSDKIVEFEEIGGSELELPGV